MNILNAAMMARANAFAQAGVAGETFFRNGGSQLLNLPGQSFVKRLGANFAETGGAQALVPSMSAMSVSLLQRAKEILPGGAAAARQMAFQQAAGAAGRASGASALIGAGVATIKVAGAVNSGAVTLGDAAQYVGIEAAKDGAAGLAGAAAITLVVALSGPVAPLTAVTVGAGAAMMARAALPKTAVPGH